MKNLLVVALFALMSTVAFAEDEAPVEAPVVEAPAAPEADAPAPEADAPAEEAK